MFSQSLLLIGRLGASSSSSCRVAVARSSSSSSSGLRLTFLQSGEHGEAVMVEHNGGSFLFDCGEQAPVQLRRAGLLDRGVFFHDIFISHLHGDHVWGLPLVLREHALRAAAAAAAAAGQRTLPRLWGPQGLRDYVTAALGLMSEPQVRAADFKIYESPTSHRFTAEQPLAVDKAIAAQEAAAWQQPFTSFAAAPGRPAPASDFASLDAAADWQVYRAPMYHTVASNGYVFQEPDSQHAASGKPVRGRKIVMCGDTSSAAAIVPMAMDCDVLVHEAAVERALFRDARLVRHSTAKMAGIMASRVNAKALILTHVTKRMRSNADYDINEEIAQVYSGPVYLADDMFQFDVPQ